MMEIAESIPAAGELCVKKCGQIWRAFRCVITEVIDFSIMMIMSGFAE